MRWPRSSACPPRTPRPLPCGAGHAGAVSRVSRQRGVPVGGRVPAHVDTASPALVADGHLGKDGSIQNWQCQACGGHASDRFGTFLYRLKKPEKVMAQTLTSVSQGQGIRATALSQGVNKDTVLAWWLRLDDRLPHPALNRHDRIGGECHAPLGVEVQHGLPQTDAPGLQHLGVGHVVVHLSPQHEVN